MKSAIITAMLIVGLAICAWAQEEGGRYRFYTVKNGSTEFPLLLDTETGRNWQVIVDATGKVTKLSANTVEGVVYNTKDEEQLYTKVKSADVEGLSTSDSATKAQLDEMYGYGFSVDQLKDLRDKMKAAAQSKR